MKFWIAYWGNLISRRWKFINLASKNSSRHLGLLCYTDPYRTDHMFSFENEKGYVLQNSGKLTKKMGLVLWQEKEGLTQVRWSGEELRIFQEPPNNVAKVTTLDR